MQNYSVYFVNSKRVREFSLRILATLSKEDIRRINKTEFIEYLTYLMNDGRYDDQMKIMKKPSKKIDNNNAHIFARDIVEKMEMGNTYFRTVDSKEGEMMLLDEKALAKYRRVIKKFAVDDQHRYDKIADDWKNYKYPKERRMSSNGVALRIRADLPNGTYTICTEERKGIMGWLLSGDKDKIKRWDLLTDGEVEYGSQEKALYQTVTSINPETLEEEDFKARQVRKVSVVGADFVAIQGYVGDILTSSIVYTPLAGKQLDDVLSKVIQPLPKNAQVTNEAPYVKKLMLANNK